MYIRAKYPSFYRPYMQDSRQGFGGLSGGQNTSVVDSTITENSILQSSYSFEGRVLRDGGSVIDYCGNLMYLLGESLTGGQNDSSTSSNIQQTELTVVHSGEILQGGQGSSTIDSTIDETSVSNSGSTDSLTGGQNTSVVTSDIDERALSFDNDAEVLEGGQSASTVTSDITIYTIRNSSYSFELRVSDDGGTIVDDCGQLRYLLGEDLTGAQQVSQVDSQIAQTDLVNSSYYFEYRVLQDGGVIEYHNTRLMYLLGENLTGGQHAC